MLRYAQHDGSSRQLFFADVTADQRDELRLDRRRSADDVAALEPAIASREIADHAAGLRDHQRTGRHIPWRKMQFEEAVEDAGRGVGEVERRRPRPPHALGMRDDVLKNITIYRHKLLCTKGKAGGEKRSFDGALIGDVHANAVTKRTAAALGGEEEIAQR